jgi:tetratricopeptide (TPR) repeat protein
MNDCGATSSRWMNKTDSELVPAEVIRGTNRSQSQICTAAISVHADVRACPRFLQAKWWTMSQHAPQLKLDLLAFALLLALVSLVSASRCESIAAGDRTESRSADRIQSLIEQLGATQFARRERAQQELRHLGVAAFEALHEAQANPDVEIRKQAEYLLHAIRISWIQEEDAEEVQAILRKYRTEGYDERQERLDQLGELPQGQPLAALCRLARFETSDTLARRAALAIMQYAPDEQGITRELVIATVNRELGNSTRMAARWLRLYARYLVDPAATIADWQELITTEIQAVQSQPDKERLAVVADLLRWQIEAMQELGRADQMLAIMKQLMPLQGASEEDVQQTIEWLIDREAWKLVDVLIAGYPHLFAGSQVLRYRQAEALLRQDQKEAADRLAAQVREMPVRDDMFLRVELAEDLKTRGLFDWAEQQYREEIKQGDAGDYAPLLASIRMGYMFHDLAKNQAAYDALRSAVELAERETIVKRRMQELKYVPNQVRSQMHFSHALALAENAQWKEHCEALEESLKFDHDNADILIAMYRVPSDKAPEQWPSKAKQRVEALQSEYLTRMTKAEQDYQTQPNELSAAVLAMHSNQYAWLVSNTFGDFEQALKSSLRSLELSPDEAGYLDTLGRCYFALKDYPNAVKHQQRAVELEPHSGQIGRQLELFQRAARAAAN